MNDTHFLLIKNYLARYWIEHKRITGIDRNRLFLFKLVQFKRNNRLSDPMITSNKYVILNNQMFS